tara:strand:- start:266 stop:550 length:285 start_codon:yes stop_codon:yes gene_type:complete
MSLAIDVDKVTRVCVVGHWYDVLWKDARGEDISTFLFDSYEFVTNRGYEDKWPPHHLEHGGGDYDICAKGFEFVDAKTGNVISGPMTSIDAVAT